MNLTFTCPETLKPFFSKHYALLPGHGVAKTPEGRRQLKGMVMLTTECPECGGSHCFKVEEVMCPLNGGET